MRPAYVLSTAQSKTKDNARDAGLYPGSIAGCVMAVTLPPFFL